MGSRNLHPSRHMIHQMVGLEEELEKWRMAILRTMDEGHLLRTSRGTPHHHRVLTQAQDVALDGHLVE